MRHVIGGLAVLAALALPGAASAQGLSCRPPAQLQIPRPELPSGNEPARTLPIGGYTLALTWTPGFCRAHRGDPKLGFQCTGGARFGFTLHGLWPDGVGRQWPQYCRSTAILPPVVIGQAICATPSEQLIQHEWAKHGTCMAANPGDYFGRSTRLYGALRFPDMNALSRRPLTVAQLKSALAAANPAVPATAVRVTLSRGGWLDELWLCLDRQFRYARCRAGSGGAPDAARVKIWRGER